MDKDISNYLLVAKKLVPLDNKCYILKSKMLIDLIFQNTYLVVVRNQWQQSMIFVVLYWMCLMYLVTLYDT